MNALKQWFQSLTTGQKIVFVACIWINISVIIGFAILGLVWNRPITIIPIIIIAVCMMLDVKRLIQ